MARDSSPILRHQIDAGTYTDQDNVLRELVRNAHLSPEERVKITQDAAQIVRDIRGHTSPGIMEVFLAEYGLSTDEGVALMCLAEALLRVPDAATADALIRDKIGDIDWAEHMGESSSTFVNAATFSLMLTGEVLVRPEDAQKGMGKTLKRAVNRLGDVVFRTATLQAMRILGVQVVYGRTIQDSL